MGKVRYSIFVSSTYEDLKEERKEIQQAITKMGHIPVGMENFLASDDTQWEAIRKQIDECDYYVLIIGKRYGSIEQSSGISYTQKEYQHARDSKIPILSFVLNENSDAMSGVSMNEDDNELRSLNNFKNIIKFNKIYCTWSSKSELIANVIISLYKQFEENPRTGWVRNNFHPNLSGNNNEMAVGTKENLENWQQFLNFRKLSNNDFENVYKNVEKDLNEGKIQTAESLAVVSFVIALTNDSDVKTMTPSIEQSIYNVYKFNLSNKDNQEDLYRYKLNFIKTINYLKQGETQQRTLQKFIDKFNDEFSAVWEKTRNKMVIALEDITDDSSILPLQLLNEPLYDYSMTYMMSDIFDKVNIERMCTSIKLLSNEGRGKLYAFFIERYKLRYRLDANSKAFAHPAEIENLNTLVSIINNVLSSSNSIDKLSYEDLLRVVKGAIKRSEGSTEQLLEFN